MKFLIWTIYILDYQKRTAHINFTKMDFQLSIRQMQDTWLINKSVTVHLFKAHKRTLTNHLPNFKRTSAHLHFVSFVRMNHKKLQNSKGQRTSAHHQGSAHLSNSFRLFTKPQDSKCEAHKRVLFSCAHELTKLQRLTQRT